MLCLRLSGSIQSFFNLMSGFPAVDDFLYFAFIDDVIARLSRKAERRIDDAPPIIARTRSESEDKSLIDARFQRIFSIDAGGELLFRQTRFRAVRKAVSP